MKESRFATRHPYLFAALMLLLVIAVYVISGAVAVAGLSTLPLYVLANVTLSLIAVVILAWMRWWREVGLRPTRRRDDLWLFLPLTLTVFVNLGFTLAWGAEIDGVVPLLAFAALSLAVGFTEEVYFRGFMLRALAPRGVWRAAIITAVLFGVTHLLNALAGADLLYTLAQIGWALAIGFAYAAVALRTGAIWPLVLIHALTDFTGWLGEDTMTQGSAQMTDTVTYVAFFTIAVFTVYGYLVLRGRERDIERTIAAP